MQLPKVFSAFLHFAWAVSLPLASFAHLLTITNPAPFPATIAANSKSSTTFTITNISNINLAPVDQSQFSPDSGLSVTSTCNSILGPGQTCTLSLTLNTASPGKKISGAIKFWAKPSADAVQYPFVVQITSGLPNFTLVPIDSSSLPALRDPIVGYHNGNWLILSGSFGSFHDFHNSFNTSLYVFNPTTSQIYSVNINSTDLPIAVKNQLASSSTQALQDGDTLYIIGGFYNQPSTPNYSTINTISSFNVPDIITAIINGQTNLASYVAYNTSISQFKVTGGQLGKMGDNFYLAFGQDCEGDYCDTSQVYTNSIYEFSTDPSLTSINILKTVSHDDHDGSGWRRRDYTLAPWMLGFNESLLAMGGPFTPGDDAYVWTNGITFNPDLTYNDHFINQKANQYLAPHVTLYSAKEKISYIATFSGLSNLYWATSGLVYDDTTPYGNVLDLIRYDSKGKVGEYVNLSPQCSGHPLSACLYMGLSAQFIPVGNFYDARDILQLDELPNDMPTLIGYVYGGLLSTNQEIFGTDASYATNQAYAVYYVPQTIAGIQWENVSNYIP